MYVESLGNIIPWMLALVHYRYARWMTMHVKDLLEIQLTCPAIYAEFQKGNFVTQRKTRHKKLDIKFRHKLMTKFTNDWMQF